MRVVVAVMILLICCGQGAARETPAANKPSPATVAYEKGITTIASQAVLSEVSKHSERLNGVLMKLRYTVDQRGRVHNVRVVSGKPDRWAEKTAVRVLAAVEFYPIPEKRFTRHGEGPHRSRS
jgi:TonB family protein